MAKKTPETSSPDAGDPVAEILPPGVTRLRTFTAEGRITSVAFDPAGKTLAGAGSDYTVMLWDLQQDAAERTLDGHQHLVYSVAFAPGGDLLASASADKTVKLWDVRRGTLLRTLEGHQDSVLSAEFVLGRRSLVSGSDDSTVRLWDVASGTLQHTFEGHSSYILALAVAPDNRTVVSAGMDGTVRFWDTQNRTPVRDFKVTGITQALAFSPRDHTLARAGYERTVEIWDPASGKLLRSLEGHTKQVNRLAFSANGRLLASISDDSTIRLFSCDTWETVAVIPHRSDDVRFSALAFHPTLPILAGPGFSDTPKPRRAIVRLCELNQRLLGEPAAATERAVHHTTGKIVLVGDHSVGKSALACRLMHDVFREQASTHGQQFWVFPALGKRRADGTECEAILWDFAGQPDYRLVHALFVDNTDLALVLFDSTNLHDPLHGVGFWLKQLHRGTTRCSVILVAAQTDRGTSSLTAEELDAFCRQHQLDGPIATSAFTGVGVPELLDCMRSLIPWDEKPATVTTTTFKRVKDYVLGLKTAKSDSQTIVTAAELRDRLQRTDPEWRFSDDEMLTAVGHLENYGYVKRLRTSRGDERILLEPERLNNLASSLVLAARRNPKGLGALEEKRLLTGGYEFPELEDLQPRERDVLLDSAALLFLEHNVCFRETDPLRKEPFLVFPELINLKKPLESDAATEEGTAYTVTGPTENVFASLVVLLGYTHTFTRTTQWQNNARYEVGDGLVCGFRQEAERDGELDFVLCFGENVGAPVRTLFQGQFESFLARRQVTVTRHEPVRCLNDHLLDRSVVRQRLKESKTFAFCNDCGEKLTLPKTADPIQLTREVQAEVASQHRAAEQRTRFEQAVFRLRAYVNEQHLTPPGCFISYAWGTSEHERWVEKRLAVDLQKAGIDVALDRWHNAQIGASVARFVERIATSDRVVMVGTPLYRRKYENRDTSTGYVVAAEVDLINNRLLGTEEQKRSVLPVLLDGDKAGSFPALLQGRVHADFRDEVAYFTTAFDLILSLYQLPPNHGAVADLRELLRDPEKQDGR